MRILPLICLSFIYVWTQLFHKNETFDWNFLVYTYHDGGGVAFRRSLDSSPNQRHPKGNQSSPSSMYETFLLLLSSKKRMAIHLHTNNSYE